MAKLILTDAEKNAGSLNDWSDTALGKTVRLYMAQLLFGEGKHGERNTVYAVTCAKLLARFANDVNATQTIISIDGLRYDEQTHGDWRVVVEKIEPADSSEKARRAYVESGYAHCPDPDCKSDDIEGDSFDVDLNVVSQECRCHICGRSWTDEYTLTGVHLNKHSDPDDEPDGETAP